MKTKVSLSIIGVFNVIMSLIMAFAITDMTSEMLNTNSEEVIRMVEVMHYGLLEGVHLYLV